MVGRADPRTYKPLWEKALLLVAPRGAQPKDISGRPFVHAARLNCVEMLIRQSLTRMGVKPVPIAQVTPAANAKKVVLIDASSILPYTIFSADEVERYQPFPVPDSHPI